MEVEYVRDTKSTRNTSSVFIWLEECFTVNDVVEEENGTGQGEGWPELKLKPRITV